MRISDWSSDLCSSDLPRPRRIIREFHLAIMLFDDLLDDREAQPGAALPRRHIGFGDRVARLRQPDSVVGDDDADDIAGAYIELRSEEHTSELQSLMRISYAVFCLKKKKYNRDYTTQRRTRN